MVFVLRLCLGELVTSITAPYPALYALALASATRRGALGPPDPPSPACFVNSPELYSELKKITLPITVGTVRLALCTLMPQSGASCNTESAKRKPERALDNEARMSWDHDKVYEALVKRGERQKTSDTDKYVTLYPQKPNCAILYRSDGKRYHKAPVHLHYHSIPPRVHGHREGWDDKIFHKISPALEFFRTDKPNQEDQAFSCYQVSDWDKLAEALGLK